MPDSFFENAARADGYSVVCGIDESGFDAVYTARAYIEMSGAFTGEGYSLLTGASVNGASGGRERAER